MFIAGKVLWLLVQPLSLVFFLLLLGMVLSLFGLKRTRGLLSVLAVLLLFATLFTSTGSYALQALENRFQRPQLASAPACAIILGGAFEPEIIAARGGFEMNQSADRFIEALRLARQFPTMKLVVSGGDGSFSGAWEGDAVLSTRFFAEFGIDASRVIKEETSRNTAENVANTQSLLQAAGLDNCLLITSAYHMPRAVGLFRKLGMGVAPWPSDYRTTGKVSLRLDFTQPSLNAQLTATAMREWTGLLAAYLKGDSHQFLPQ